MLTRYPDEGQMYKRVTIWYTDEQGLEDENEETVNWWI